MSATHLRERQRTAKAEPPHQNDVNTLNMSRRSDNGSTVPRQLPQYSIQGGKWGGSSDRHVSRHPSGEELLEGEVSRIAMDLLEREGEQVVFMKPRITELQVNEEEGDGDSGISCEDHLLSEGQGAGGPHGPQKEKLRDILVQVFIPFMIAGFGMMAAGLLLDAVQVHLCIQL